MPHLPLPTHPLTGLTAITWRKARPGEDPDALYPVWPILGGAEGDAGDGDDGGQDDGTDDQSDDGDQDGDRDGTDTDDPEDALGDKGKKALRELRQQVRSLKAQLKASARPAEPSGDEEDPEAIRERIRQEVREEVWTERVQDAAIAAASGRLANPQLAARLLDLSGITEDDKGRPDRAAISELIDELLEDEPYLAAPAKGTGRRFQGDADGGARKTPKKTAASLGEAVANRLAAGKSG